MVGCRGKGGGGERDDGEASCFLPFPLSSPRAPLSPKPPKTPPRLNNDAILGSHHLGSWGRTRALHARVWRVVGRSAARAAATARGGRRKKTFELVSLCLSVCVTERERARLGCVCVTDCVCRENCFCVCERARGGLSPPPPLVSLSRRSSPTAPRPKRKLHLNTSLSVTLKPPTTAA